MIGIIDYGSGNIKAIANIYHRLDIPAFVASSPADVERAERLILPGVGAFDQTMQHLQDSGLVEVLNRRVRDEGVPFLGICVGMQLLARRSDEGLLAGLGWLDAEVRRFDESLFTQQTHLPHLGWNDAHVVRRSPLFEGLNEQAAFYFLHSYYMACDERDDVVAETEYGLPFASVVSRGNISGVQFHPEKSHDAGVQVLRNFATAAAC